MSKPAQITPPTARKPGAPTPWLGLLPLCLLLAALFIYRPVRAQPVNADFIALRGPERAVSGLSTVVYELHAQGDGQTAGERLIELTLPPNFNLTRLDSGYLTTRSGRLANGSVQIRYRTSQNESWRDWLTWRDLAPDRTDVALAADLSLPDGVFITALRFVYPDSSPDFVLGELPGSRPRISGALRFLDWNGRPVAAGDPVEACAALETGGVPAAAACTTLELVDGAPDIALWGQIEDADGEPARPGEIVSLRLDLANRPAAAAPLDNPLIVLMLPAGVSYLPGSQTWEAAAALPLPDFQTAVDEESGETRLSWHWPTTEENAFSPGSALSVRLQVRLGETAGGSPLRFQLLAAAETPRFICWGEFPRQSDRGDIDRDGDLSERICAKTIELPTAPAEAALASPTAVVSAARPGGEAAVDLGDAPLSYGAARHRLQPGVSLGLIVDGETAVDRGVTAAGDDTAGLDDEEGIFWGGEGVGTPGRADNAVTVVLLNRQGHLQKLNGWIDFNADGHFSAAERIINGYPFGRLTNPQARRFSFAIPAGAVCGETVARFRLSPADTAPDGEADSGEVEDIRYTIECSADLVLTALPSSSPIGRDETLHWTLTVTNTGPSTAENLVLVNELTPGLGFLDYQTGSEALDCLDPADIIRANGLTCRLAELAAGRAITVDLALIVPRTYPAQTITNTAQVSSDTPERDLAQNYSRTIVALEKRWVLGGYRPVNDYAFTHVSFNEALIQNPDLLQRDFRLDDPIANHIQVPISIAFGFNANTRPWLTVPSCDARPEDPTCNSNNRVDGLIVVEHYAINRILYEDGTIVYQPETAQKVYLNRVADSNLSRCAGSGSCIGFDLFRVERGGVTPYAWQAPADYFYLNFITKGGRAIGCPAGIDLGRCVIVTGAKPGRYRVEATLGLIMSFDDRRLGDQPLTYRLAPYEINALLKIFAPFTEPER